MGPQGVGGPWSSAPAKNKPCGGTAYKGGNQLNQDSGTGVLPETEAGIVAGITKGADTEGQRARLPLGQ